ncbi:flagella basal body P-ring formation protein FlgA [Variovorax sp. CF313]|nr:flagella basal body P-ring formation protein FlgA [Variovorax sp. CF313]
MATVTVVAAAGAPSVPASSIRDVPVSIELRPRVQVEGASVRLGDIAFLTTRDLGTLRKLMAVPIGAAPRAGAPIAVDRNTVMRWVESRSAVQAGDAVSSLRWSGAGETLIETAAQDLAGETVVDAARSALLKWLQLRSLHADVQSVSTVRDLVLPAGQPVLRVRPIADQAQPARRMLVWVDAWVGDRFVRTTAVAFEVNAWAQATVATSPMTAGAQVDGVVLRGATETREVDLTALPSGRPARLEIADGGSQRLRKPLKPGEVLTDAHLQSTPSVTRGNWAQLLARSGDVSVESRVEVLQDGRPGQFVRVKVPGSSGEVLARVTGPGQVEVQP